MFLRGLHSLLVAGLGFKPSLLPLFIQLCFSPTLEVPSDLQGYHRVGGVGFSDQWDLAGSREPLKVFEWESDYFSHSI